MQALFWTARHVREHPDALKRAGAPMAIVDSDLNKMTGLLTESLNKNPCGATAKSSI